MLIDSYLALPLVGRVGLKGRGGVRSQFNQYTDIFCAIRQHEITPHPTRERGRALFTPLLFGLIPR
jgi:hypothetical protein